MGMGLQYTVNHNHTGMVTVESSVADNCVDPKHSPKEAAQVGFEQTQESMDTILEHNIDCIRNTMLKHDEIFKDQVIELHRLYRAQKILMDEAELNTGLRLHCRTSATSGQNSDIKSGFLSSGSTSLTSQSRSHIDGTNCISQLNSKYIFQQAFDTKTSIVSGEFFKRQTPKDFVLSTGAFQNKRRKNLHTEEDSGLELTLSIGCEENTKRSKHGSCLYNEKNSSEFDHRDIRKQVISQCTASQRDECSERPSNLDRKSVLWPSWFPQALSLNRK